MAGTKKTFVGLFMAVVLAAGLFPIAATPEQAYAASTKVTAGNAFDRATNLALTGKSLASANQTEFNDDNDNNFYSFVTSDRDSSYKLSLKVYNNLRVYATVYDSGHHRIDHFSTNKSISRVFTNLKRNRRYYVELWRYADTASHAAYRIKMKEVVTRPSKVSKLKVVSPAKKQLKVSYASSYNASGYKIGYKKGNGKWSYVKTKKTSYVITGLKSKKKYTVKVVAYRTVNKKNYKGSWTVSDAVKTL